MESLPIDGTIREVYYTELPDRDKLVQLARLYANAFSDAPWNEYKVCNHGHYFGRKYEDLSHCNTCHDPLEFAYPEDQTVDYITQEIGMSNSSLITFEDQRKDIYAAAWGYECTIEELKAKYETPEMQEKIESAIKATVLKVDKIFFLSEIMVDISVRKKGIGTQICNRFLERANELGLKMVICTHNESPMAVIAEKKAMLRIIDAGKDTVNEGRVLYITK